MKAQSILVPLSCATSDCFTQAVSKKGRLLTAWAIISTGSERVDRVTAISRATPVIKGQAEAIYWRRRASNERIGRRLLAQLFFACRHRAAFDMRRRQLDGHKDSRGKEIPVGYFKNKIVKSILILRCLVGSSNNSSCCTSNGVVRIVGEVGWRRWVEVEVPTRSYTT